MIDSKFEIFKILIYEIVNKIGDILKSQNENENILSFERNPSNIVEIDLKKISKEILSYFLDINSNCAYYDDLILFFYKLFISSEIFLNFVILIEPNVISKIFEIVFDRDNVNNNDSIINKNKRKLIMIKLLCKIIENIKESSVTSLSESLQNLGKENIIIQNPIEFLYEKILSELNKNKKLETIILKYYINLLIICANKALELEKRDFLIKAFINNENIINYLLFNDNHLYISENNFLIKHYIPKNFEKFSLFNSEINLLSSPGIILASR